MVIRFQSSQNNSIRNVEKKKLLLYPFVKHVSKGKTAKFTTCVWKHFSIVDFLETTVFCKVHWISCTKRWLIYYSLQPLYCIYRALNALQSNPKIAIKVMTPVNNVIRLDNKHQLTYNSWGKGWDKEVPVFHLSISNSQYTQAFSENDYRAFDTAEFLLNLKQWVCSHAETGFIKLT